MYKRQHNTYQSLSSQKVQETQERIKMVQKHQKILHKRELEKISFQTIDVEEEPVKRTPKRRKRNLPKDAVNEKPKEHRANLLYLNQFDQTEQKLLKLLWKNGKVKPNEALNPRKEVLNQAGTLKGKSGVLSNLYAKLLDKNYVEFNKRYRAKVALVEG